MGRKKRLKRCEVSETYKANDHISRLHDDIICYILSLVPLRDAVRTSVLSSRWRNLWKQILQLNFDLEDFDHSDELFCRLDWEERISFHRKRASKFIKLINSILNCRMSTGLSTLKINCSLDGRHAQKIDKWISFAISSGIKELHLRLDGQYVNCMTNTMPYEFPIKLFSEGRGSSVTCIALQYCTLRLPLRCQGLKSLKILDLKDVSITEIDMQNILSGCALEGLNLTTCRQLPSLQCSLPCPQLKYLKIVACSNFIKVELSAPNLVSFEYAGCVIKLKFKDSLKLKRVIFHLFEDENDTSNCSFARLQDCLAPVEFLYVTISFESKVNIGCFKQFAHLKHLILGLSTSFEDDLLRVATILNAAPVLNTLELQLCSVDLFQVCERERRRIAKGSVMQSEIRRPFKCPHTHLTTVLINGFIGLRNQIELAIYILNNSVVLKSMTVDFIGRYYMGEDQEPLTYWSLYKSFAGRARKMASKYLLQEVPSGAKLVIC